MSGKILVVDPDNLDLLNWLQGRYGMAFMLLPGSTNPNSTTNPYQKVHDQATPFVLESSASAQNIGAGGTTPVGLFELGVKATTTGTITLSGLFNPSGTGVTYAYPAITIAAGASPVWILPPGPMRLFPNGLTITCSVAADGLQVFGSYAPIN